METTTRWMSFAVLITGLATAYGGSLITDELTVYDQSTFLGAVSIEAIVGASITNGLVLHFTFDTNSATVTDQSGNGHTGTVNGATWVTNGMPEGAFDYDGVNDYVEVAGTAALNLTTALTLTAWAWFDQTGTGNSWVFSKRNTPSLQYGIGRYADDHPSKPNIFFAGLYAGGWTDYVSTYEVPTNEWVFLAVTYDKTAVKLYVNGVYNTSYNETDAITGNATSRLTVGADAYFPTWNEFTDGKIDEVRVYNRALSNTEILGLYLYTSASMNPTNAALIVDAPATLLNIVPQGDIDMGIYTNRPD